eukprot:gene5517-6560_t
MATVTFKKAQRWFPGADKPTVPGIDLEIRDGEFMVLVGPSGCGKSTLMMIIAGLHKPSGGELRIGGGGVTFDQHRDIGMVFQQALLLKWRTVIDNILLPAEFLGLPMKHSRERARDLLNLV